MDGNAPNNKILFAVTERTINEHAEKMWEKIYNLVDYGITNMKVRRKRSLTYIHTD